MKIMDFLNKKAVTADMAANGKQAAIRELIDLLVKAGEIRSREKEALVKTLMDREGLGSTGIGLGVAIPHGKSANVRKLVAAFGLSRKGIEFESLDGEPAHIFFLLIAPTDSAGPHLKALARISRLLRNKYFRDALYTAKDAKAILKIINDEDKKQQH